MSDIRQITIVAQGIAVVWFTAAEGLWGRVFCGLLIAALPWLIATVARAADTWGVEQPEADPRRDHPSVRSHVTRVRMDWQEGES